MTILRTSVLAAAFALSAASPVFAADGGREDGQAWLLNPGVAAAPASTTAAPARRATIQSQGASYQVARDMNMSGT